MPTVAMVFDQNLAEQTLEMARSMNAQYEASTIPIQASVAVPEELAPALLSGLNFVSDRIKNEIPNQRLWFDRKTRSSMKRSLKTIAGITGTLAVEN